MTRPLVIAFVFLAPAATADVILQDAAGDVSADAPGGTTPLPAGVLDSLDVLAIEVSETETDLGMRLAVAGAQATAIEGGYYEIGFRFDDTEFRLTLTAPPTYAGSQAPFVDFERRAAGSVSWIGVGPASASFANMGWEITFQKALVTNEVGLPIKKGDVLREFWATSLDYNSNTAIVSPVPPLGTLARAHDEAPDDLRPTGEFILSLGAAPAPAVQLSTPRPIRASNGEETTLVFEVTATNTLPDAVDLTFTHDNLPYAWSVSFLREGLHLPPGSQGELPLVVSIPFRHEHGSTYFFNVTAHDLVTGAPQADLQLGVHYLDIPQPSGHHPTLFWHAEANNPPNAFGWAQGRNPFPYMNTLATDDTDSGNPIGPTAFASQIPASQYSSLAPNEYLWCIPLDGALLLGLDFDMDQRGLWQATMSSGMAFEGTLQGRLLVSAGSGDDFPEVTRCTGAAVLPVAQTQSLAFALAGQEATIDVSLDIEPLVDVLPFVQGRQMFYEVKMQIAGLSTPYQVDAPWFHAGAFMALPLLEYHEEPESFEGGLLGLEVSPTKLLRRPGTVAVFNVTVRSLGSVQLELYGTHVDWADVPLKSRDRQIVQVVVRIPSDAVDGAIADLLLKGTDLGSGEFSLARLVVEVDQDGVHPDDAEFVASPPKDAGLGALAALGGVLVAFFLRFRR